MVNSFSKKTKSILENWSSTHSYLFLAALTLLCLLPFSGRAFHIDDPLFIWSAQQIVKHPFDPYGFQVVWDNHSEAMAEVTKNPPLACYYAAMIGSIAGWSERALHLGFLLPAVALVLGTYRLSIRFTRSPLIAAAATLLTPGVLVSASSVMSDVMMLALWIWAAVFWVDGFDTEKPAHLALSTFLIALAALTKYFGICLLPLLLVYSLVRRRRADWWIVYFAFPIAALATYQYWTRAKYGHAMFFDAIGYAEMERGNVLPVTRALIGASFAGGCALSVSFLAALFWDWKKWGGVLLVSALSGLALSRAWLGSGPYSEPAIQESLRVHWVATGLQLAFAITAGILLLWIASSELRNWRDANSFFLGSWVCGTFIFATFLNWVINARSVLPLIPAAGILLARQLDKLDFNPALVLQRKIALALLLSGAVSVWLAKADADWANSAHEAAAFIHQQSRIETSKVWFEGHWGFQYYMQLWGAQPVDFFQPGVESGDLLIVPDNADAFQMPRRETIASASLLQINLQQPLSTMRWPRGAGFYSSFYGPLPFAFGPVETERYYLFRLNAPFAPLARRAATTVPSAQNTSPDHRN